MNSYLAKSCAATLMLLCLGLAGCAEGRSPSTCEVWSPGQFPQPTTQDDQRIEAQGSGEPGDDDSQEQHCP
ncbi:hypothetical protein D3879_03850 [Pseudomonas cavernicola]|uniref:Secreted protein n=1 Tax=Pseudomonas cavernicola TaxID=2320866 RepID=A0A418XIZ2_9PSED|nr:hypothetical protein [Pseudomonas cavernicola]RJG12434.1 hypothetical protein D3879_03850 [Pseudomonas cavernicola]